MTKVLRSFPFFTLFGLTTIALFVLVEIMGPEARESPLGQNLIVVLKVAIIPVWLMRLLVVMLGGVLFGFDGGSFPIWYRIITFPVLILPYLLADLVLHGWWRYIHPRRWIAARR